MAQKTSHLEAKAKNKGTPKTTNKAFVEHINELRSRVTWVVLVFIVTSAVAYNYRDILVHLVLSPLGDQKLIYLTPAGGFSFIFQITMYAGAVVTAPILIYHLYRFVVPALPKHAREHSFGVIFSAILLMLGGVAFGYFVAIPAALHFLTTFAGEYVQPNLTADSYLGFVLAYVAGLGVLFQLPLLLVFWNWMTPLGPTKLLLSERYVIVFAFIAAAIMTPTPDVLNQSLIAIPIIAIYQFGVIAVILANQSSRRKQKKAELRAEWVRRAAPQVDVPDELLFAAAELSRPIVFEQPAYAPEVIPADAEPERPQASQAVRRLSGRSVDGINPAGRRPQSPQLKSVARPSATTDRTTLRPPVRVMNLDGIL